MPMASAISGIDASKTLFKTGRSLPLHWKSVALAMLALIAPGKPAWSADLKTGTVQAWDAYIQVAQSRMKERLDGAKPFLWVQESEQRMRFLRAGGIPVEAIGDGITAVEGGLIHDWIGAVFVPGVSGDEVWATLDDYDEYRRFYKPTVIDSRLLARDANKRRFSMKWAKRVSLWTNAIDADYESSYFRPRPDEWWSVSRSTRIQEIKNRGRADERLLPVGTGAGYIWRLFSIMRMVELDGGVVIELEAIVLSRGIPAEFAWLVNPIVNRLSRSALLTTLTQTKQAVMR